MIKKIFLSSLLFIFSGITTLYIANFALSFIYVIPQKIPQIPSAGSNLLGSTIDVNQYEFNMRASYNSNGFREKELGEFDLSDRVKRILFLGDSFSEGWGVQENKRFSNLTANELNKTDKNSKYVGINLSQLASGPIAYHLNLLDYGIALKPNYTVLTFFSGNDFMIGRSTKFKSHWKVNHDRDLFYKVPFSNFFTRINLNYVGALIEKVRRKKEFIIKKKVKEKYWEVFYKEKINLNFVKKRLNIKLSENELATYLKQLPPWFVEACIDSKLNPGYLISAIRNLHEEKKDRSPYYNEADYKNVLELLVETNNIARKNASKFIIVIIPSLYDVKREKLLTFLREVRKFKTISSRFEEAALMKKRLIADLEEESINVIDMTSKFREETEELYYLMDGHLNDKGHELVAEELKKLILEEII